MKELAATRTGTRWLMKGVGEPLEAVAFDLPPPGPGQALIEVAGCGVCHTDLGFLYDGVRPRAPLPLALGHEISGVVVDAGPGAEAWVGRAVIVPAVTPCGTCELCRSGSGTLCRDQQMPGNDVHGGFATHVLVRARGLCPVEAPEARRGEPIGASGATLAELSVVADAISTPYQAVRRAGVGPGDFAAVVGLGGVGGFAAQIAHALGATVVGFDVAPSRLARLSDHGLARGWNPGEVSPKELRDEVRAFARETGHRLERWKVFECSGTTAGQALAWALLGPGAWLSVVGYTMEKLELRLSNLMAFDATAAGNWGCLPELYPDALRLVLEGKVAVAPFVGLHPLADVQRVLEDVRAHRLDHRPVLVPEGRPS